MDRRKAIKRIGASFGAITISSGVISLVQSCNSPTTNKELSFFSKNEINFLDRILEIIIPETDSPGANSLNLSKFVDAYVAKNIRTEDQKYLNAMIEEFINMIIFSEKKSSIKDVENKTLERYFSEHIDNGSMIADDGKNYSQICDLFRRPASSAYISQMKLLIQRSKQFFVVDM